MVGSDKNQSKCKKLEFDIKKDERPISFYGVVDKVNKKKGNQPNSHNIFFTHLFKFS